MSNNSNRNPQEPDSDEEYIYDSPSNDPHPTHPQDPNGWDFINCHSEPSYEVIISPNPNECENISNSFDANRNSMECSAEEFSSLSSGDLNNDRIRVISLIPTLFKMLKLSCEFYCGDLNGIYLKCINNILDKRQDQEKELVPLIILLEKLKSDSYATFKDVESAINGYLYEPNTSFKTIELMKELTSTLFSDCNLTDLLELLVESCFVQEETKKDFLCSQEILKEEFIKLPSKY